MRQMCGGRGGALFSSMGWLLVYSWTWLKAFHLFVYTFPKQESGALADREDGAFPLGAELLPLSFPRNGWCWVLWHMWVQKHVPLCHL